jgi:hypothetical protein
VTPIAAAAPAVLDETDEDDGELDDWFGDEATEPTTPKRA